MTTNLEWLYENDRDALIVMASSNLCKDCAALHECAGGTALSNRECIEFREEWLEAEYVEPDSWEKAEWDACNIARKISEHYGDANLSNEICMIFDRCKKLAGVE